MHRVIAGMAAAFARCRAFLAGNLIATAILAFARFVAVGEGIALVTPARESCHLPLKIVEPVGDRLEIFADQIKIVVFEVSV